MALTPSQEIDKFIKNSQTGAESGSSNSVT